MAEKLGNKYLYKIEVWLLKVIPFIIAGFNFLHTILFTLGIGAPILLELASLSFIPIVFFYLSSYVFKFCEYHRVPLHYVVLNNTLNLLDYHFQIPISDYNWIIVNSLLFGAFAIGCGIMKILNK